ncbi:MAG: hypothetical protein IT236_01300, partial [Bacteroidia bacterium]|nr:hypothetical protein [Bacteroidia bacterium]
IAGKVYDHDNEVYLIFFKSYKQEAYVLNAMEKNDVNGIEQNKNALVKTSAEGLEKLKAVVAYQNDQTILKTCKQMLEFYKEEAEKKLNTVSTFYVAKDSFEKIKTGFDAKSANKRTQSDVDQFNKAVNEYNAASQEYNKVNAELNNNRKNFLDDWNKSCEKFTDKHVPKG